MAEMRTMSCPSCERANQPRAIAGGIEEYRCAGCGMVYYGPCGCDTVHETKDEAQDALDASGQPESALPADWEMSSPDIDVANPASADEVC